MVHTQGRVTPNRHIYGWPNLKIIIVKKINFFSKNTKILIKHIQAGKYLYANVFHAKSYISLIVSSKGKINLVTP